MPGTWYSVSWVVRVILAASKICSLQQGREPLHSAAVVLDHGIIRAVGPLDTIINKYPFHKLYTFRNAVLMPGLVNLHTHLELPAFPDRIHVKTFPDWILKFIKAKKKLHLFDYCRTAKENIRTLIETGTTTAAEIVSHGVSPALLCKSGLRALVFHEIIDIRPGSEIQGSVLHKRSSPAATRVRYGISPHTPYTVSESLLQQVATISRQENIRLCMHIAESKSEIDLLRRKRSDLEKLYRFANWDLAWAPRGSSSFEYLKRIRFLSSKLLAVHAVYVTDGDIKIIKKARVAVAHCPRSNRELRAGKMPLKKFLDAGITVGLGTDSLASSPSLNMWDEMRYAYKIHRQDGVSAEDIFRIATIGGARALGLENEVGTLVPGKRADIIAVPLPGENTGNLYSDLLRESKFSIMNMVDGRILFHKRYSNLGFPSSTEN